MAHQFEGLGCYHVQEWDGWEVHNQAVNMDPGHWNTGRQLRPPVYLDLHLWIWLRRLLQLRTLLVFKGFVFYSQWGYWYQTILWRTSDMGKSRMWCHEIRSVKIGFKLQWIAKSFKRMWNVQYCKYFAENCCAQSTSVACSFPFWMSLWIFFKALFLFLNTRTASNPTCENHNKTLLSVKAHHTFFQTTFHVLNSG